MRLGTVDLIVNPSTTLLNPHAPPFILLHQTSHAIGQPPHFLCSGFVQDHMTVLIFLILVLVRILVVIRIAAHLPNSNSHRPENSVRVDEPKYFRKVTSEYALW